MEDVQTDALKNQQDRIRAFAQQLLDVWGNKKGCWAMILLGDEYFHAKKEQKDNAVVTAFECQNSLPLFLLSTSFIKYQATWQQQFNKWHDVLTRTYFVRSKPSLMSSFMAESDMRHHVVFCNESNEGSVRVYDQCERIYQRILNKKRLQRVYDIKLTDARSKVMDVWCDAGIFYILGHKLFYDHVIWQDEPVDFVAGKIEYGDYMIVGGVERSQPEDSNIRMPSQVFFLMVS